VAFILPFSIFFCRLWSIEAQAVGQQYGEEGLHETCAGGEEAPFGNEELCDDDVAEMATSHVPTVENQE